MNDYSDLYDIRDFTNEDLSFVLSTFIKGVYYGDSWFKQINKDLFMKYYTRITIFMLTNSKLTIKVACLKEDPNVILGYSMLSPDYQAIAWVYVKAKWRNKGIGKSLVPKYPLYVTHLSKTGKDLLNKLPTATFNPFYGV